MPPVKRLLPPRSSAEAFSSTSTCAPASQAARAAVKAALPAPTTTTSLNSSGSSTLSLRIGSPREPAAGVLRCARDDTLKQLPEWHMKPGHDLTTGQFLLACQNTYLCGRVVHVDLLFLWGDHPDRLHPVVKILPHLGQHVRKDIIGTDHLYGEVG